jgi:hypothetical protein
MSPAVITVLLLALGPFATQYLLPRVGLQWSF